MLLRSKINGFKDGAFTIPDVRWRGVVKAYRLARREGG